MACQNIMKLPHIVKKPLTDVRTLFGISEMVAIFAKTRQNFKVPGFQVIVV
jgi:hypothetical protein